MLQYFHTAIKAIAIVSLLSTTVTSLSLRQESTHKKDEGANDQLCKFDWDSFECVPSKSCTLQFRFGDFTFNNACRVNVAAVGKIPQQFHLAYAGTTPGTGMTISWTTYAVVEDPFIWVGTEEENLKQLDVDVSVVTYYKDKNYELFSYHATVNDLTPHTKYFYKVGSGSDEGYQSDTLYFTTARTSELKDDESYEVAIYGDFGVGGLAENTLEYIVENINAEKNDEVDFVLHVGDISYADNDFLKASNAAGFFYEETYNEWMNTLTPTMSMLPYMVTVGNHEAECHSPVCVLSPSKMDQLGNYNAYNSRWAMPSKESSGVANMWYSFQHGPIHYTSISTETDYPNAPANAATGRKYGGFGDQLNWLEQDLKKANDNRDKFPWVIVLMHRSIYTIDHVDDNDTPIEQPIDLQKAFEQLFIKYGVDLVISGHVHAYERQYPIANNKPIKDDVALAGSADGVDYDTYTNPKAPVYLVTGAAGQTEGHEHVKGELKHASWNIVNDYEHFGISMMKVSTGSLYFQFIDTDTKDVRDEFEIIKTL